MDAISRESFISMFVQVFRRCHFLCIKQNEISNQNIITVNSYDFILLNRFKNVFFSSQVCITKKPCNLAEVLTSRNSAVPMVISSFSQSACILIGISQPYFLSCFDIAINAIKQIWSK